MEFDKWLLKILVKKLMDKIHDMSKDYRLGY